MKNDFRSSYSLHSNGDVALARGATNDRPVATTGVAGAATGAEDETHADDVVHVAAEEEVPVKVVQVEGFVRAEEFAQIGSETLRVLFVGSGMSRFSASEGVVDVTGGPNDMTQPRGITLRPGCGGHFRLAAWQNVIMRIISMWLSKSVLISWGADPIL